MSGGVGVEDGWGWMCVPKLTLPMQLDGGAGVTCWDLSLTSTPGLVMWDGVRRCARGADAGVGVGEVFGAFFLGFFLSTVIQIPSSSSMGVSAGAGVCAGAAKGREVSDGGIAGSAGAGPVLGRASPPVTTAR